MSDAPAAAVFCGEMCNGCKDDCAACATMACGDCGGCEHGRELSRRGRAAKAALALLQIGSDTPGEGDFGFNPRQRRGPDGRWIDMGGPGSAGGRHGVGQGDGKRRAPGGGDGPPRKNADHPARAVVERARFLAEEKRKDGGTPNAWLEDVTNQVDKALDAGDDETVARFLNAIERSNELQAKLLGEDVPDEDDGVTRGVRGWREIMRQQKGEFELTRDQIQGGLEEYLSNPRGYKAINQVARDRSVPFDKMTKAQQERVRQLDRIASVFDQDAATLQQDTEVWRGVRDPGAFLGDLKPGMEFIDDAPVSTSLDKEWATNFAADWGDKKTDPENSAIFKILMKKGQKGLLGAAVAGEFGDTAGWEKERELLLPPGTRFRVVGKTDSTDANGKKIPTYELEAVETPVLPPRATPKKTSNRPVEAGRNLKKPGDLPMADREKVLSLMRELRDQGGHASTTSPELQDALVEAIVRDVDLNTRSAKLIIKDLNKYGGLRW